MSQWIASLLKSWDDIPNTMDIIQSVAKTHYGIGYRIALMKAMDVADLGAILLGEKGSAKTASINALTSIAHKDVVDWDFQTTAGLSDDKQEYLVDNNVTWVSRDLSKSNEYLVTASLTIICALIYDHSLIGDTAKYSTNITNARLSWFGATTHEKMAQIWDTPEWRGNFSDRIFRLYCISYKWGRLNRNVPRPECDNSIIIDYEKVFVPYNKWLVAVKALLRRQFTSERAEEYAVRLLQGMAAMNGRRYTLPVDAKFILMQDFFLRAENRFSWRENPTGPLNIDSDALLILSEAMKNGGVYASELADLYRVEEDTLMDSVKAWPEIFRVDRGPRHTFIRPSKSIIEEVRPVYRLEALVSGRREN